MTRPGFFPRSRFCSFHFHGRPDGAADVALADFAANRNGDLRHGGGIDAAFRGVA
jgi:hypothetical protein